MAQEWFCAVLAHHGLEVLLSTGTGDRCPKRSGSVFRIPLPHRDGSRISSVVLFTDPLEYLFTRDKIIDEYPHLKLEQIHDALSYYYEHKTAFDKKHREDQVFLAQLKKRYPSKLRAKLA